MIRKEGQPAIIPHENWRGQFSRGTYTSGAVSDCTGQTTGCTAIAWPGHRTNAWHQRSGSGPDIRTWFGGLVDGMRDASGQMYMRNRYYDPGTGQFTQTDPIGLGGGLNATSASPADRHVRLPGSADKMKMVIGKEGPSNVPFGRQSS